MTDFGPLSETETRAKLIALALYRRGWKEDIVQREEDAGALEVIGGKARRLARDCIHYTLLRTSDVKASSGLKTLQVAGNPAELSNKTEQRMFVA